MLFYVLTSRNKRIKPTFVKKVFEHKFDVLKFKSTARTLVCYKAINTHKQFYYHRVNEEDWNSCAF